MVTGLAAGYYLGARAGRQRYDQINRQLTRLKRSEAFDEAAERARAVVTEGVEKARSLVDRSSENGAGPSTSEGSGLLVAGATGVEPTAEIIVPGPADLADLTARAEVTDLTGVIEPTGTEGGGYSSSR